MAFRECQVVVVLGTSTQPSHLMNVHLVPSLPVTLPVPMTLPSYPFENLGLHPFHALEIQNLVLNLVHVLRRVFLFTPRCLDSP
jgi:hypothetical protein